MTVTRSLCLGTPQRRSPHPAPGRRTTTAAACLADLGRLTHAGHAVVVPGHPAAAVAPADELVDHLEPGRARHGLEQPPRHRRAPAAAAPLRPHGHAAGPGA